MVDKSNAALLATYVNHVRPLIATDSFVIGLASSVEVRHHRAIDMTTDRVSV
jgi:hypothetical protein